MLLYSQTYARLCTGDMLIGSKRRGTFIVQITLHLDAETLQSAFPDARRHHRHVCDNGFHMPRTQGLIQSCDSPLIHPQDTLHIEIGRRMNGMQQSPFAIQCNIFPF